MDPTTFPTKGNLILAKNTLRLSKQGYELMDKKRSVLIKEIMQINEKAKEIQGNIDKVFSEAYTALQSANIELGLNLVELLSYGVPHEESVDIKSRSVMGVEIPLVSYTNSTTGSPLYGFGSTSTALDLAAQSFNRVKDYIIELSSLENAAYRLAINIRKTQKRANALKNVTIPKYEALVKSIQDALEERERDEFTRLKVVKKKGGQIQND